MSRYKRQIVLPEVGETGQKRLSKARVLVVGAGGLGSPVLQYLVAAGVGRITVIDPDHVEESNLHRQPIYRMSDLGKSKVEAARLHLISSNPDVSIYAHCLSLHPANAVQFVTSADVVVDAADSFAVSYTLSDTCLANRVPLVSASALAQTGYVGGFCGPDTPSLRAVFPNLPERGATCASEGVLGPVVGLIGTLQSQIALQVLLDHTPSPMGKLVTVDLQSLAFGGFTFSNAPEPHTAVSFISQSNINSADQVIELRNTSEAPFAAHPAALRLSGEQIENYQPNQSGRVVLCCTTGLRAWHAANILRAKGHDDLAILATGASE